MNVYQFWARDRGFIIVEVERLMVDKTPLDALAEAIASAALAAFNRRWPGCHRDEMHCVGASDFSRDIDALGRETKTVYTRGQVEVFRSEGRVTTPHIDWAAVIAKEHGL